MAKIMGNIVGLPSPRSDWNQTDETKADYIKNKPIEEIQAMKSLMHYGDANIVPSDANLFGFTPSPYGNGAAIEHVETTLPKGVVIPYEATIDKVISPVTFLWDMAFNGADVESIVLPNTVTEIGVSTFEGCKATSITIPQSVKTICDRAFYNCKGLKDVYYTGTKAQWDAIEITNENEDLLNATIHYEWIPTTKGYVDKKVGEIKPAINNIYSDMVNETLLDNTINHLGIVFLSISVSFPEELDVGYTSALYFSTPAEIPSDYSNFPEEVTFGGDSTEDGRFIPEASTRYTIVFDYDGENINGYVRGVSL